MSPVPPPVAALGDTLTLTLALLAIRYLLLWRLGALPRARWAADWVRRIAAVVVILPAIRLFSLTGYRPDAAMELWGVGLMILGAGGLAMMADIRVARMLLDRRQRR